MVIFQFRQKIDSANWKLILNLIQTQSKHLAKRQSGVFRR
jgi:hypothetical protein